MAGKIVPETEVKILREREPVPTGDVTTETFAEMTRLSMEPGEIIVTGGHVVGRYIGEDEDLNKISVEGRIWHRTGDCGYFDKLGRLWLLGRRSAVLAVRDTFLFPLAVECEAHEVGGISDAALCVVITKQRSS